MAKKSFRTNAKAPTEMSILTNTTKNPPKVEESPVEEFPQAVENLIEEISETPKRARKKRPAKRMGPTSEIGCKEGDTRKTFIMKKELAEKMLDIAYWTPGKLKDHVNKAFEDYAKKHWDEKWARQRNKRS